MFSQEFESTFPPVFLASSSPARKRLLEQAGFTVTASGFNADEETHAFDGPEKLVFNNAGKKLSACLEKTTFATPTIVAAFDTVISLDNTVWGKPVHEESARTMLKQLSGREHAVYTGMVCFHSRSGVRLEDVSVSTVRFSRLDAFDIDWYIQTREWQGAAGGYRIQGAAELFISSIKGSFSNIAGLPLNAFYGIVKKLGNIVR